LDCLVIADRLPEGFARLGVLQRLSQRRRADAERLRRNRHASAVEGPHGDAESFARTAQERVGIQLDVV
jgi:hypothetical protein